MAKNNSNFIVKFSSKPPVKSNSRAMVKAKPKTTKASATVHESQQTAVVYKDGKTAVMRQKMKVTASKDGLKTEKVSMQQQLRLHRARKQWAAAWAVMHLAA
jgi:hypothetical protein